MKKSSAGNIVLTPAELDRKIQEGYVHGYQVAQKESTVIYQKAQAMAAATKLMEEAGRMMSRAGYMIGKVNNDNSR